FQFGPPLEIKLYRSIRFFSDYQPHLTSQPANWFLSFRTIEIMAVDALPLTAVTAQVQPRLQAIHSGLVLAKTLLSILLNAPTTFSVNACSKCFGLYFSMRYTSIP